MVGNWTVIGGSGAIGALVTFHLAKSLRILPLVLTRNLDVEKEIERELSIKKPDASIHKAIFKQSHFSLLPPGRSIEKLLITTKAPDTLSAFEKIESKISENGIIVLLQNGMGNHEEIASRLIGRQRLLVGITTHAAFPINPFIISHVGLGKVSFGWFQKTLKKDDSGKKELNVEFRALEKEVMKELAQSGLNVEFEEDIEPKLWKKLAINCCINPLTLILNCQNGKLADLPGDTFSTICQEVSEVMRKSLSQKIEDQKILDQKVIDYVEMEREVRQVVTATKDNYSSMLQDYQRGRKTEIDFLNGFVVKKGREFKVQVTVNETLYNLVKLKSILPKH